MKEVKNENFEPKIIKQEISIIPYDYTLHLDDLKNTQILYDMATRQISISFEPIYVKEIEHLILINTIFGSFKNYSLNGYYEKAKYKFKNIEIGEDIIEFLYETEKDFLKNNDLSKLGNLNLVIKIK